MHSDGGKQLLRINIIWYPHSFHDLRTRKFDDLIGMDSLTIIGSTVSIVKQAEMAFQQRL